jgi:hypothetical protein
MKMKSTSIDGIKLTNKDQAEEIPQCLSKVDICSVVRELQNRCISRFWSTVITSTK